MPLGHDPCLDTGTSDDRLAESASRIDHDAFGLRGAEVRADPGIESLSHVAPPLDASETFVEDIAQKSLPRAGHVEKPVGLLDEEAHAIGAEPGMDERPLDAESVAAETEGLADLLHRHAMHPAHRGKHERFDQVVERERERRWLRRSEQRLVFSITAGPEPQRGRR